MITTMNSVPNPSARLNPRRQLQFGQWIISMAGLASPQNENGPIVPPEYPMCKSLFIWCGGDSARLEDAKNRSGLFSRPGGALRELTPEERDQRQRRSTAEHEAAATSAAQT